MDILMVFVAVACTILFVNELLSTSCQKIAMYGYLAGIIVTLLITVAILYKKPDISIENVSTNTVWIKLHERKLPPLILSKPVKFEKYCEFRPWSGFIQDKCTLVEILDER